MKGKTVFAIVTAPGRRMRCRVARVVVEEVFELGCAMVTERTVRGDVTHFLPFARLASKRKDIATKLRAYLVTLPATPPTCDEPREESEKVTQPEREPVALWYQREAEEFSAETAGEQLAGVDSQTAAA